MDWKNEEERKEYYKKYNEKHKEERKEYNKKYYKEYYKNHKEEKKEYIKEYSKDLYRKAIERILNYYNMKPICFFCGKEQSVENEKSMLCVEHKSEQLTGKKDNMQGNKLYKHILDCDELQLDEYQIFCRECNTMKERIYEEIDELQKIMTQITRNFWIYIMIH